MSATSTNHPAETLIDLTQYPIADRSSQFYKDLISRCQIKLSEEGVCTLPGFLHLEATARMASETDRIVHDAFRCHDVHNPYLENDDLTLSKNHPRRQSQDTSLDVLGYDLIDDQDGLHILYNWDPLVHFIAEVLDRDVLYRMADPLAAVTVNVMREGQHHGWHFDEAEITTSIMLQAPESGGQFQYVPQLRSQQDENYEEVARVLDGSSARIQTLDVHPGTMVIFAGHYAMHRVTPVMGSKTRYVAILCFKEKPHIRNSPEVQMLFYGKTAQ